jgi:dihydropteroate synthase
VLAAGYPLLAGWSRKSSLGRVTGQDEARDRVAASVAAAVLAVERGARIVRVHDVRETADALKVWQAMAEQEAGALHR